MQPELSTLDFDPRFENYTKLPALTRRGFLRGFIGASATGLGLFSLRGNSFAENSKYNLSMQIGKNPEDETYWQKVRDQFLIHDGLAYMNTGTKGPSPRSVYQSHAASLKNVSSNIPEMQSHYFSTEESSAVKNQTREKLADFLGAKPSEIAFTNNTTEGMIFGTMGVSIQRGDQIIYTNHDHPYACNPILHRAVKDGLEVKVIDLSAPSFHPPKNSDVLLKAFEQSITKRTKLISFCHMNYTDGCIMPVKEICAMARSKGIVTLVDGAQPPGMMKLNLHDLGADMYAGACHKWMLAGMHTGFLYIREGFLDQLTPMLYTGPANGQLMNGPESKSARENRLRNYSGAAKFEMRGSLNFPSRISVNAALDFLNQITPEAIEKRDRYLATFLIEKLKNIDGVKVYTSEDSTLSCGIVSFNVKQLTTSQVNAELWDKHNIWIRNVRQQGIDWDANRASMHVMVTVDDIDRLAGAVEELAVRT